MQSVNRAYTRPDPTQVESFGAEGCSVCVSIHESASDFALSGERHQGAPFTVGEVVSSGPVVSGRHSVTAAVTTASTARVRPDGSTSAPAAKSQADWVVTLVWTGDRWYLADIET